MMNTVTQITVPAWLIQSLIVVVVVGAVTAVVRQLLKGLRLWVGDQLEVILENTKEVVDQVTPNGGNTNSNGDITKRIELMIQEHVSQDLAIQRETADDIKSLSRQMKRLCKELENLGPQGRPTKGAS
jgi:sulfite reductase alpha subunit-like flavoprotein